ncbi:MAG TPA: serine/threonine-protein kinase [Candidatus Limnocylindrales bacterium]|nr:serine/threonine-protein kinase [Candidatus Limnocylindrales bacterium]
MLLSDIPEVSALVTDTAGLAAPQGSHANLNLTSAVLAALGQRYDILSDAGCGSMGNVYKARDRETGETVALKLLKPEISSDQAMMDRFKNELLFARKITHKNVCRVHEFNRINGIAYTSMEFVEGESLRSVINRFGALSLRKGSDLALQICSGLKEAHAQGIVHRDLKPENVMIDAQGNVKIMDFGIARSMEAATRHTGSMVGTPAYMAPEQVAGKPVDYRTDIYSLGLMLYEMFTGSPAFTAENPVAVALKQMREAPPPPRKIEPMIPPALERAILKCLDKEPARRYQSVAELETALRSPGAGAAAAPAATGYPPTYSAQPARNASPVIYSSVAPKEEPRHGKSALSLLLQALVLAGAGWGAWKSQEAWFTAENQPPPPALALPKLPDSALDFAPLLARPSKSAAPQTAVDTPPAPAASNDGAVAPPAADSSNSAPAAAPPKPATDPAPRAEAAPAPRAVATPVKKTAPQTPRNEAPPDVQARADQAFGEAEKSNAPKYLWIGRFQREDKAQAAAKKLEDLGLPVAVIPKPALAGKAYVVFAGPVGAKRVPSVMEWLKAQGFENVRAVDPPAVNSNLGSAK